MIALQPVPGFGTFPDGRLRAGPFAMDDVSKLRILLREFGVHPGFQDDKGLVSRTPAGLVLSASGPCVRGYFMDSDGIEVSSSDLDALLLDAVTPGTPFRTSGHWCPDRERMIVSEATAIHDGHSVDWSRSRMIHYADGTVQPIGRAPLRAVHPFRRMMVAARHG